MLSRDPLVNPRLGVRVWWMLPWWARSYVVPLAGWLVTATALGLVGWGIESWAR